MGRVALAALAALSLAMAPALAAPPVAQEAVVETTQGRFVIRLRADLAPMMQSLLSSSGALANAR